MLMNNLDPEVAERPADLVVYGGTGKAARSWEAFDVIVRELEQLGDDETLLVQSGKAVGRFKTHPDAPRVLLANSLLVPKWATWEHFRELESINHTTWVLGVSYIVKNYTGLDRLLHWAGTGIKQLIPGYCC